VRVSNLHALKIRLSLRATELELFDDIRNSFKPVTVILLRTIYYIYIYKENDNGEDR
jgi:hypothetical protein